MNFNNLKIPKCKKFSGYKPCVSYINCLANGCQHENGDNNIGAKILIISLDALGNVLLNTSILKSLKTKYPKSTIYWITQNSAISILHNNQYIDEIFSWNDEDRMILRQIEFDVMLNGDKSHYACAFANEVTAKEKFGFGLNTDGKIVPLNEEAMYNYMNGIDDEQKFRKNTKSGSQIIHETFALEFNRDKYIYNFTPGEIEFINQFKEKIKYDPTKIYVGFNTGCSNLFPNKKMTIDQHVHLIKELANDSSLMIVLLGGKEDTERNLEIYDKVGKDIQQKIVYTPTGSGIRYGACFMELCDLVITGDSFGMHLAIALNKYVIAWFGLSCWSEIDLYDNGEKLYPEGLECSPCWKKVCPFNLECIEMIDLEKIVRLVKDFAVERITQNSKN